MQASGLHMPTALRTDPTVQKSAPRRHEITDPLVVRGAVVTEPSWNCRRLSAHATSAEVTA